MYALVKDIYRLAEAFAGMKRIERSSRKGLSPLLAIIIGLIVTIVAGILLAQLYFSYAATISARPAANIEYSDLVVSGTTGILALNIKNIGNVPITGETISVIAPDGVDITGCSGNDTTIQPGATAGITCTVSGISVGQNATLSVVVSFGDGSSQAYAVAVRARSA